MPMAFLTSSGEVSGPRFVATIFGTIKKVQKHFAKNLVLLAVSSKEKMPRTQKTQLRSENAGPDKL